jgi:hypothetical protein
MIAADKEADVECREEPFHPGDQGRAGYRWYGRETSDSNHIHLEVSLDRLNIRDTDPTSHKAMQTSGDG